jgi:hypothetical protein
MLVLNLSNYPNDFDNSLVQRSSARFGVGTIVGKKPVSKARNARGFGLCLVQMWIEL